MRNNRKIYRTSHGRPHGGAPTGVGYTFYSIKPHRDVGDAIPYNQTECMTQSCRGGLSSADSVKSQDDCHRQSATSTAHTYEQTP